MYTVESFRDTVLAVTEILHRLGVHYHLTGGAAVFAYGEPRMTQDFDLVVDQPQLLKRLSDFRLELKNAGFLFDESGIEQSVSRGLPIQVLDSKSVLKLDIYPRELIPGELSRSRRMPIFGEIELFVVALPDLAMSKLVWISKGSHKSRRDLRSLLRAVSPETRAEVVGLANELKLFPLLEEVLKESDEINE